VNVAYRHAAVCIDLRSVEARQLLHRAASLVGGDGRLSAVTVIEVGTFDDLRDAVASLIEEEYLSRSAHLARLCAEAGCPDAEQRVLVGKAAAEIASYADHSSCDLVVLGEHHDRAVRPRLGSTADATLRLLRCDALVVRTSVPRH
jgi:nucleotide-binding universal stress UspA family protein